MAGRWWRAYDEAVEDPKLQRLPPALFKFWFNVLCIASRHGGVLPAVEDIAFTLRVKVEKAISVLDELVAHGLVDRDGNGKLSPHNWDGRQFQSDTSTPRVKRFRKRRRNVSSDVSETAPDTDTDTDTDTEQSSEAIASAAPAAPAIAKPIYTDSKHELWGEGVPILVSLGVSESRAKSNVGRWLRDVSDDAARVLGAIQRARDARVVDPIPWVTRALQSGGQDEFQGFGNGYRNGGRRAPSGADAVLAGVARVAAERGLTAGGMGEARGPIDRDDPRLIDVEPN